MNTRKILRILSHPCQGESRGRKHGDPLPVKKAAACRSKYLRKLDSHGFAKQRIKGLEWDRQSYKLQASYSQVCVLYSAHTSERSSNASAAYAFSRDGGCYGRGS